MKKYKILYSLLLSFIFICSFNVNVFAADPKLISTLDSAFKKIESYLVVSRYIHKEKQCGIIAGTVPLLMIRFAQECLDPGL